MSRSPSHSRARSKAGSVKLASRRWFKALLLVTGLGVGFAAPYFWQLDRLLIQRMAMTDPARPSRMFGRPLPVADGARMSRAQLEFELNAVGYVPAADRRPGSFVWSGSKIDVYPRGDAGPFSFRLVDNKVSALRDVSGGLAAIAELDPPALGKRYAAGSTERNTVELSDAPALLLAGVQAVEDRRFNRHHGIDLAGIARASWTNLRAGEVVQGGSTLTQQLIKSLFFGSERRWLRKIHEAALALLLEWRYDKQRILQGYVNEVFLGQQGNVAIHGFASAAQYYFGLELSRLEPHQGAMLIALLKGPSYYNPWRNPDRAKQRRDLVLQMLYDTGLLSRSQLEQFSARGLDVLPKPSLSRRRHPAFVDLVKHQVARGLGPDSGDQGGHEGGDRSGSSNLDDASPRSIYTTLSAWHQHQAEQAVSDGLRKIEQQRQLTAGSLQAALVLLDRSSGDVLAAVGGRQAGVEGFNRALNARRPVGSIIKPFVYLAALREGYSLANIVHDEPLELDLPNGEVWAPGNFSRQSHGPVPLLEALTRSYNQATAQLGLELGVANVLSEVRQLGWQGEVQPNPSLLLGAIEMTPIEVAQLYLSLTGDGDPRAINAVREVRDGNKLSYRSRSEASAGLSPANYLLTFALRRAVVEGTGRSLAAMLPRGAGIAGKTGTSNDLRDSWFVGFSSDLLAVVWVGRDDNQPAGVTGATGALQVFGELFAAIEWQPLAPVTPRAVEYAWIEMATGRLADSDCPGVELLPFINGTAPLSVADCMQYTRDESRRRRWWKFWR